MQKDDVIYKQAAIDALGEEPMVWMDSDYEIAQRNQWRMDKLAIETLPSAQPELIEKTAYIRGFEQGRTQRMIDAQGGKK